jgi:ribosomal protein S15P/S13E
MVTKKTIKKATKKIDNDKIEIKNQKLSEKDYEKKVIELAKQGLTSEKIGESLRQQKIHPKEQPKKISKILKENNIYVQPDLKNVETKLNGIKSHFESNKQDKRAKREKDRVFSQLRKLKIYHKLI